MDYDEQMHERRVRFARNDSIEKMKRLRGQAMFTRFAITEKLLLRHIVVLGATGSGKTNHAFHIIGRASKIDASSVFVIDVKKEYRKLQDVLGKRINLLAVADEPLMEFNPLIPPPKVEAEQWDRAFADVFIRAYGLSEPSRRIILDSLAGLREHGVGDPTLRELEIAVAKFAAGSPKEQSSRRSTESRLHNINTGAVGRSLNNDKPLDFSMLEGCTTVFEIGNVDSLRSQRFLAELVLAQLWQHDREQLPQEERLHRLIVVEEAHRYLSEERPPSQRGERTLLELSIAEARRYGWGFLIIDQMPLLLSRYVWDNAGTVLAHRLTNMESCKLVKSALGGEPISKDDDSERDPIMLRLPENMSIFHRYVAPESTDTAVGVTIIPRVESMKPDATLQGSDARPVRTKSRRA